MKKSANTTYREYDAKIDSKKRLTLRETPYEYYHVEHHDDGIITLYPRELVAPPIDQSKFKHKSFEERLEEHKGEISVLGFDWGEPVGKEML